MQATPRRVLFLMVLVLLGLGCETGAESESFWQQLCHVMWRGSDCPNLAAAIAMSSQKGERNSSGRLYLVNAMTGELREWSNVGGTGQPTICPDGKSLFYRRGSAVFRETIHIEKGDIVRGAEPSTVDALGVHNIYSCTLDMQGVPVLWVEDGDDKIVQARIRESTYEKVELPLDPELAKVEPRDLAEKLGLLRGIRRDGYHVWVRNHKLVGQKPSDSSLAYIVKPSTNPSVHFSGSPAWIGDSDYLFVTASEN